MVLFRPSAIVLLAVLLPQVSPAQLRNANWIFGEHLWVNFTEGEFGTLPQPASTAERTACMSDTEGNFLLLADDHGIRDPAFASLSGGSAAELGWNAPMGNFLILPHPAMDDRYFVFVIEEGPDARAGYVEVDIAANGGAGAVLNEGTTWFMDGATTKLTAALDANGTGYWVVLHKDEGTAFHAFALNAGGFSPAPVISETGHAYLPDSEPYRNADRYGLMEFSVQGDRLAAVQHGPSLDTNVIALLAFDPGSGLVESRAELTTYFNLYGPGTYFPNYVLMRKFSGIEFSEDGDHLYAMMTDTQTFGHVYHWVQFPIHLQEPSLIQDSTRANYFISGNSPPPASGDILMTGLDGALYYWYWHPQMTPPNSLRRMHGLPMVPFELFDHEAVPLAEGTFPLGFPNQCRNYHDSHPTIAGVPEEQVRSRLGVHPNPVQTSSTVTWQGSATPDAIIWWDSMGRQVRRDAIRGAGPQWTIERKDMPVGAYVIGIVDGLRTLARAKVICD